MQDILFVIDMQNDFIDGALGTIEAKAILPAVKKKIQEFKGAVFFTRDTHYSNYLETQEGKKLPVEHCILGTDGWKINPELEILRKTEVIDKECFGSLKLVELLKELDKRDHINSICFVGLCTDICVISNAMIVKSAFPEVDISVDASCCAGVSPKSHENALEAMSMCQINII